MGGRSRLNRRAGRQAGSPDFDPKWVELTPNGTNPGIFFQIRFSTFVTQSEVGRSLSDIPTDVSSSKADNGVEIS